MRKVLVIKELAFGIMNFRKAGVQKWITALESVGQAVFGQIPT